MRDLFRLTKPHNVPTPDGEVELPEGSVIEPSERSRVAIADRLEPVEEDYRGPVAWRSSEWKRHVAETAASAPAGTVELVVEQEPKVEIPFDPAEYSVGRDPLEGKLARAIAGIDDPEVIHALQRVDTRKTAAAVYERRLDELKG